CAGSGRRCAGARAASVGGELTAAVRTVRHVPERTCIGCRRSRPKREMTRVVRAVDGTVDVDPTGKRSGRGAYVCNQAACWEQALKRRSLDRALKTEIDEMQRARLAEFARTFAASAALASAGSEGKHAETIQ